MQGRGSNEAIGYIWRLKIFWQSAPQPHALKVAPIWSYRAKSCEALTREASSCSSSVSSCNLAPTVQASERFLPSFQAVWDLLSLAQAWNKLMTSSDRAA